MGILCDTSAKQKLESAGININISSAGNGPKKYEFFDGRQYAAVKPSTSPVKVMPGNNRRISGSFRNDPGTGLGDNCYLMISTNDGPQVSSTFHTVRLAPNEFYELPTGKDGKVHMGEVWVVFGSVVANNFLQAHEGIAITLDEDSF